MKTIILLMYLIMKTFLIYLSVLEDNLKSSFHRINLTLLRTQNNIISCLKTIINFPKAQIY